MVKDINDEYEGKWRYRASELDTTGDPATGKEFLMRFEDANILLNERLQRAIKSTESKVARMFKIITNIDKIRTKD